MNETNPPSPRPGARKRPVDEVERMLPMGQLFTLGLQHVLVMYAGAVAVPLVIGGSLGLPKDQISYLISSDLFCCGIVTLLQCVGIGRFAGIRLPVIMSVTFAAVMPMLAIGANPDLGLTGIFGATIAAGIISTLLVPLIGRLMPLFPTVVTGVVITSIGISIMQVGIDWMAGGKGNPEYGSLRYIGTSFLVLVFILLVTRFTKGFFSNISVLLGIIFGFVVAIAMGEVSLDGLGEAAWFAPIVPFAFGWPTFDPISIATLTVIMLITFIESMGMFLALGDIVGHPARRGDIVRGLRVDGIGTIIGGIFNSFPHTSFSQNIGLVSVTGVSSRWVCVMSGGDPARLWPHPQDVGAGRLHPALRAGGRRYRDVRHGAGHRYSHPGAHRLQQQPSQPLYRRHQSRNWHDPDGLREFFPTVSGAATTAFS